MIQILKLRNTFAVGSSKSSLGKTRSMTVNRMANNTKAIPMFLKMKWWNHVYLIQKWKNLLNCSLRWASAWTGQVQNLKISIVSYKKISIPLTLCSLSKSALKWRHFQENSLWRTQTLMWQWQLFVLVVPLE